MRFVRSVVIAGMPASGKTTVALMVAKELGLKYVAGGDILKEIARSRGYSPSGDSWWDGEEGKRFLLERMSNPEFDLEVDRRLKEMVLSGGYAVTSYAIPWLVGQEVLKVWLKASRSARAQRMAMRDGIPQDEAESIVAFRDDENVRLYERLYGYRLDRDLEVFHLVVDTEWMPPDGAAAVIVEYARRLWGDGRAGP